MLSNLLFLLISGKFLQLLFWRCALPLPVSPGLSCNFDGSLETPPWKCVALCPDISRSQGARSGAALCCQVRLFKAKLLSIFKGHQRNLVTVTVNLLVWDFNWNVSKQTHILMIYDPSSSTRLLDLPLCGAKTAFEDEAPPCQASWVIQPKCSRICPGVHDKGVQTKRKSLQHGGSLQSYMGARTHMHAHAGTCTHMQAHPRAI